MAIIIYYLRHLRDVIRVNLLCANKERQTQSPESERITHWIIMGHEKKNTNA